MRRPIDVRPRYGRWPEEKDRQAGEGDSDHRPVISDQFVFAVEQPRCQRKIDPQRDVEGEGIRLQTDQPVERRERHFGHGENRKFQEQKIPEKKNAHERGHGDRLETGVSFQPGAKLPMPRGCFSGPHDPEIARRRFRSED